MNNMNELKVAIIRSGMTLSNLAEKIGINPATLSRKVRGDSEFTLFEIKKIRSALDLSINDVLNIFFGEELAKTQAKEGSVEDAATI